MARNSKKTPHMMTVTFIKGAGSKTQSLNMEISSLEVNPESPRKIVTFLNSEKQKVMGMLQENLLVAYSDEYLATPTSGPTQDGLNRLYTIGILFGGISTQVTEYNILCNDIAELSCGEESGIYILINGDGYPVFVVNTADIVYFYQNSSIVTPNEPKTVHKNIIPFKIRKKPKNT